MSEIQLVRHGESWRYLGPDGLISRAYDQPSYENESETGIDWLTGLPAVVGTSSKWLGMQLH